MDNLDMELPRKLDAATIAALFPDLDAVRSRVSKTRQSTCNATLTGVRRQPSST